MLKKINNKQSLVDEVAENIVKLIHDNSLKPGEKLASEPELMKALNVGRGTVREAVKLLVSRNILVIKRGIGTYVSENTGMVEDPLGFAYMEDQERVLLDTLELRALIEPEMARRAAINATEEEIKHLEEVCDAVEELLSKDKDHTKDDVEFHTAIARCSHNLVISTLIPIINTGVSKSIALIKSKLKEETISTHRQIVNAIKEHDEEKAYNAMVAHIKNNRMLVREALNK